MYPSVCGGLSFVVRVETYSPLMTTAPVKPVKQGPCSAVMLVTGSEEEAEPPDTANVEVEPVATSVQMPVR